MNTDIFASLFCLNPETSGLSSTKENEKGMNHIEIQHFIINKIRETNESIKSYKGMCINMINPDEMEILNKLQEGMFELANKLKEIWKII
jgi:hypothetical protein